MIIHIIETLIIAFIAGVCGRMGGSGNYSRLYRILGVPICMLILMILLGHWNWILLICFGLAVGSSSTYFKKKGTDAHWINWMLVGLAYSFSILPFEFYYQHWIGFLIRSLVLTNFIILWDVLIGLDILEEWGRYFLVIATLILL